MDVTAFARRRRDDRDGGDRGEPDDQTVDVLAVLSRPEASRSCA